jgi:hypothetical protein
MKKTITFEWWCADSDFEEFLNLEEYEEQLEQHALERIKTMRDEYYRCGELHTSCDFEGMNVDVSGWWELFKDNDRDTGKECVMFMVPKEDVERVKTLVNDYLQNEMKELMDHKIDQHK